MDYNTLLDLVTELGYRLAMCGAETFRVEESINLILKTYGIQAEAFAIPNCLHVSIETADGIPMTRMRRIGFHGNDLDSVERYSNLSRRICAMRPEPALAIEWMHAVDASRRRYRTPIYLLGNFLGACGFALFFGCSFLDSLFSGMCGLIVGVVSMLMDRLKANQFFRTILAAFLMSLPAYAITALNITHNSDAIIIGSLMLLVPGLLFTNAMRDIIYGDTNSGINRIVQVLLIAAAISLGTAAAWSVAGYLWHAPVSVPSIAYPLYIQLIGCFIGCTGFCILFNIHGPGGLLCALGGVLAWVAYSVALHFSGNDLTSYFWAAFAVSAYSEIIARIRKYPAISYLVASIFPLIPGASVYYTMTYAVRGDMTSFANTGMHTAAIAGVIAVGVLLVSTSFRIWNSFKRAKR